MTITRGVPVGRYEVLSLLGESRTSRVYLARRFGPKGVEQLVALKGLRHELRNDEERVTMFLDEARLMASLSHPNIARVLDVEETSGTFWMALEYVHGPTLAELLARATGAGAGRLPEPEALRIAEDVCEAVAYLHTRLDELGDPLGVVHRDLKPANVIVSYEGAVKLIDFGIAKASSRVAVTRTGVVKGTRGYMAPEQIAAAPVDHRADVWAVGVLLHELLVGRHPFRGDDPGEASPAVPAHLPGVAPELGTVIRACLAARAEDRPASLRVVRDAVHARLLATGAAPTLEALGATVRALVPSPRARGTDTTLARADAPLSKRASLRRALSPIAALAAIALAGVAAYLLGRALVP